MLDNIAAGMSVEQFALRYPTVRRSQAIAAVECLTDLLRETLEPDLIAPGFVTADAS